jgi:hypothetical protein
MNNFIKIKKANEVLNDLSDIIKSNSITENTEKFRVLNLTEILSSYSKIDEADDYHEHLDGQDFSHDADDVEVAFNDYNQLKEQFKETHLSGLLFKPFLLANTVDFVLDHFSQIHQQSEEYAHDLLNSTIDAMNFPTYEVLDSQREMLKQMFFTCKSLSKIDKRLFAKNITTHLLGEMPIFESTIVEDLGYQENERGQTCCKVRTELIPQISDVYKIVVPLSPETNVSVAYRASDEGLHVLSLGVDKESKRLGYGAWILSQILQQANADDKKVLCDRSIISEKDLDFFSRQWCNFLYDTPQVNTFKSFQIEQVKYADSYKKKK